MKHVGVVIADRGSAIVHVEHDGDELLVTAVERLPFSLDAVADRVRALDDEIAEACFVIDSDGLGAALWTVLGPPDDAERWTLYAARGIERQALVDRLLVAIHEGRFHFAAGLDEQAAMSKALQGYRRQVREDGLIGGELVVALLLALIPAVTYPPPLFAWGGPLFGPHREDPAGSVVDTADGRVTLVRADDGSLVGVIEPTKEKE